MRGSKIRKLNKLADEMADGEEFVNLNPKQKGIVRKKIFNNLKRKYKTGELKL